MKKILVFLISMICLFNFYGCSNSIVDAGESIADMRGNYKANRYIRLYCDSIYSKKNIQKVHYLSDDNLSYGEKTLILEDLFNDFITERGYTGKRVVFKPVNGDRFYSTENQEVCYIPVEAFKELPFDTLPFVSVAVKEKTQMEYYFDEKIGFIKKLEKKSSISSNPYSGDVRAADKENITLNTLEILNVSDGISLDRVKRALTAGNKF